MSPLLQTTVVAILYLQIAVAASPPTATAAGRSSRSRRLTSRYNDDELASSSPTIIKRKSFSWLASLDRNSGIASSLERSLFQQEGDDSTGERTHQSKKRDEAIEQFAKEIFSEYPTFLGRPSLTLGLCRAVKSSSSASRAKHHCNLMTSLLPLNLLAFGTPVVISSKKNNRSKDYDDNDGNSGEVVCRIEIPIVGGLLAKLDNPALSEKPSTGKKSNKQRLDNGRLRFTWLNISEKGEKPQHLYFHSNKIILLTEIVGNYRPSLAGHRIPIPAWRNIFYCSTQRIVHAYVMWRFHGFAMNKYRKEISSIDL